MRRGRARARAAGGRGSRRAFVRSVAIAGLLFATGCLLANQVEPRSPNIYGTLRDDSGAPVAGAVVAIDRESSDEPCARTSYRDVTDSSGVFHLEATTRVQKWIVLVPPIERFANYYGLCISAAADSALVHVSYDGRVPLAWRSGPPLDTLACTRLTFNGASHAVCEKPAAPSIQTGGRWSANGTGGSYRLITDANHESGGVFLQWLDSAGRPVSTTQLSTPSGKYLMLQSATFGADSADEPCVHVRATNQVRHPFAWAQPKVDSSFALGAPGVLRPVRKCEAPGDAASHD